MPNLCIEIIKEIIKEVFPLFCQVYGSFVMQYSMGFISVVFMGHSDADSLAATGLAVSVMSITAIGAGSGITSGYDSLASQAYGAEQFEQMSILLQQNIIFLSLAFCVVSSLWINLDIVLKACNEPAHVASLARLYLVIYIPGLLGFFLFRTMRAYMQIQKNGKIVIFAGTLGVIIHILSNLCLVTVMKLNLVGAALSSTISMVSMSLSLAVVIYATNLHKKTWFGFTARSLLNWSDMAKISLLCLLSESLRPLAYEMTVVSIGLVSSFQLGAQAILYQMHLIIFLCPLSWGYAMSFVIGLELGAGRPQRAKQIFKVIFGLCIITGATFCAILTLLKHVLGHIFTNDPVILGFIVKGIPYMGFALIMAGAIRITGLAAKGIGRPEIHIFGGIVGLYMITLPVGVVLTFHYKLGLIGMWIGLTCGMFVETCIEVALLLFWVDFDQESQKAQERAGLKRKQISYDTVKSSDVTSQCVSDSGTETGDYQHDDTSSAFRKNTSSSTVEEKPLEIGSLEMKKDNCDDSESPKTTAEDSVLSRAIILKRLVVFLAIGLILMISIVLRYMIPNATNEQ